VVEFSRPKLQLNVNICCNRMGIRAGLCLFSILLCTAHTSNEALIPTSNVHGSLIKYDRAARTIHRLLSAYERLEDL
jgi:hypothetical protein